MTRRAVAGLLALALAGGAAFLLFGGEPRGEVPEVERGPSVGAPARPSSGPPPTAPAVPADPPKPEKPPDPTPDPAALGVLVVTVVGLPSGAPLEGATVEVRLSDAEDRSPPLLSRATGAGGLARFEGLEPDEVRIRATAPGRVPGRMAVSDLRKPGERAVTVDLQPGVALGGIVLAAGSRGPVGGARVVAEKGGRIGGMSTFTTHAFLMDTTADAEGRFRVDGIPRKEIVTLRAFAPGFVPGTRSLLLGEGAEEHPAIEILLSEAASAAGIVLDPEGRPVAGASVKEYPEDPTGERTPLERLEEVQGPWGQGLGRFCEVKTGKDGRFVLQGLSLGVPYRFCASGRGFARSPLTDPPVTADAPGQELVVEIRLRRPSVLVVSVLDPEGARPREAKALIDDGGGLYSTDADPDGTFRFGELIAGSYTLVGRAAGLQSVRETVALGAEETKEVLLRLGRIERPAAEAPPPAKPGKARIRLVPPAGSALPARVTVAVENARKGGGVGWTRSWSEGLVLLDDLPAGLARIVISVEGFAPVIREVEVPPGEERDLGTATLDTGAELSGTVQDAAGRPLAGARVWVQLPGFMEDAVATTGADGRYRVPRLPNGDLHVRVASQGMLDLRETVAVAPGVNSRTFLLAPAVAVRGTVRNGEGKPVEGVIVAFLLQGEAPPGARSEEWDTTDGNGAWDLAVVAGSYAVEVRDGKGGVLHRQEAAFDGKSEGRLDLVVP